MKSKKLFIILSSILFFSLLILAFGRIDYNISETIVNRDSIWAEFFNMFGELPFTAGMLLAVMILYGGHRRGKIKTPILSVIVYPLMMLLSFMTAIMPIRYFYEFDGGVPKGGYILAFVIAIILFILIVLILLKKDAESFQKFKKAAIILIALVLSEVILVNVLKMVWARPRMRSIDSFEQFKYWWQINGFKNIEELKSFPSGHTANAFAMIAGVSFMKTESNKKKWMIFAFSWGILTALSRVVLGAHFLSDVIFAGVVTIALYSIISTIIEKRK